MGIHEYQIVHGTPVALRYPLIRKNLRPMLLESEFSLFLNDLVGGLWLKEKASCNRFLQIFYFPFDFCDIGIKCTSATQKAADFLKGIWTYLWHTCRNEYLPCGQLHIFHRLCRDTYPRRCPCDEKTKHPFYSFFSHIWCSLMSPMEILYCD